MITAIERISKRHERRTFDCGELELDRYLQEFALQNDKKGYGATYVAVDPKASIVKGYYTLSTGNIQHDVLPADTAHKLPRYPVPSILLARLAVDTHIQGRGLGKTLLIHSMKQALKAGRHVGWHVMTVNALNKNAVHFYKYFGFRALLDDERHLFMPIKRIENVFASSG
jgi:GNAT superfamily N-acetyltransferase